MNRSWQGKAFSILIITLIVTLGSPSIKAEADWREKIPKPILDEHPGWVELYWKAWEIALPKIRHPTKDNAFVSDYMDEGFSPNIFQWDTAFMIMFGRYAPDAVPSIVSFDNFYAKQHENGFICREIRESDGSDFWTEDSKSAINPPLFSWVEWSYYELTGDDSRLERILPILTKYYDWIEQNRRWPSGLYWSSGFACGMDNSPRTWEKGGTGVQEHYDYSWIDITSQQALNAHCLSKIAKKVGDKEKTRIFEQKFKELKQLVNQHMWDKEDGFYYDLTPDGEFSKVKTMASFWPLLAGVCSGRQAGLLAQHLFNEREFYRPHPFATLSATHEAFNPRGGYWCGSVWAPTNYMAIKGLEKNGFEDLAFESSYRHIQAMYEVFEKTDTIWENYAPDFIERGSSSRGDFVGWSGCGPIALLIENVLGFRAVGARDELCWRITLSGKHGIRDLSFGDNAASLICLGLENAGKRLRLQIDTNSPFKLRLYTRLGDFSRKIPKGRTELTVKKVK